MALRNNGALQKVEEEEMKKKLHNRWIMIAGEGLVFLTLLGLGAVKTHRAFKKEVALSQRQKNFLLSVTHELKSPLASIKLYLQTLQKHDLDKARQQHFIENAIKDTDRLNILVENVLTATKIESSKYSFLKEPINLSASLDEIISKHQQNNSGKHIFNIEIAPDIKVSFDKQALSSVIINLIENAEKYSPENTKISVSLKVLNNRIYLQVSDQGAGIVDNEKSSIFEKFYRIGNEETRKTKGTGLGLFIVKYIVEHHNGKISIKDNTPTGSIFEIIFNKD